MTLQAMRGADDRMRCCGVWRKVVTTGVSPYHVDLGEATLADEFAVHADSTLIDLSVSAAVPPTGTKERALAALQAAESSLKAKPDDLNARFRRAVRFFQLDENQKSLDDLNMLIGKAPQAIPALHQYRSLAHARLGHQKEALADLAKFQKGDATASSKLYLAVIVAAELGEGLDKAVETLEAACQKQPKDAGLHYDAACAYAMACNALAKRDQAKSRKHAEQALRFLQAAIQNGYSDYNHMQEDADLDPIRDAPAFAEIMKGGHADRRYTAVWSSDASFEATPIYGLDPAGLLRKCRELIAQGYRPVSWSVTQTTREEPPVAASVWHRPVITEETKDQLAERQARAAIALLRMGKAAEVMPLLRHSTDPRLRSFIVNWLSPLGADPGTIAAELDRLPATAKPTPAQGQQLMDAVLFHPQTSQRRALILALGTYGTDGLSSGEREPLTAKFLELYRNDPDSGIHGAAAWTLRQWGQGEN